MAERHRRWPPPAAPPGGAPVEAAVREVGRPGSGSVVHVVGAPTSRGVTWVWVQEDLDLSTVGRARRELGAVLAAPAIGRVLVYLGVERFVTLRGLWLIVETAQRVRDRGGALAVVAPPRCLRMLVELAGLAEVLPLIATTRDAAVWADRVCRSDPLAKTTSGGRSRR